MRFESTLKTWNDERGFGFIVPAKGGDEIFVHIKAFDSRATRPQVGQLLTFEVELGPQGKKRARSVSSASPVRPKVPLRQREGPAQWGTATLFALPAFLLVYLVVSVFWRTPLWLAGVYAGMSLATYLAYAFDKAAAGRNGRRTPESTLHFMALACGWPGAVLAQQLLRHKSSKAEFRSVFWLTVLVNVAGFVLLCSPWGRRLAAL